MSVSAGESDSFAEYVRSDLTYEVAAADDAGVVKWKWRKWAKGMFPGGTFSELNVFSTAEVELEYGVRVSFASATGKTATDVWRFDAVTANPRVARGEFLAPQRVLCPLPPPTRRARPGRSRRGHAAGAQGVVPRRVLVLGGDVHGRRRRPDGDGRPGAALRDDGRSTSTRTSSCTRRVLRRPGGVHVRARDDQRLGVQVAQVPRRRRRVQDHHHRALVRLDRLWDGERTSQGASRARRVRALRDARGQSRRRPLAFRRVHVLVDEPVACGGGGAGGDHH